MKTVFRNILALTVSLLATPLLCGAEPVAPQSTGPSEAGNSTESMNREKPMPNARERTNHNLTDAEQAGWTDVKTLELKGLSVSLSRPRLVARSKGYLWFPTLVQREKNELLAILSDIPDVHTDKPTGLVSWSGDGGLTWSEPAKGPYADCAPLRLPNGDLLLLSNYLYPRADGAYEGASMIARGKRDVQPLEDGVTIAGWPRPIRPGEHGLAGFGFNGQTIALKDGGYLATLYGYFKDAQRFSLVAAHSEDGRHWNIRSVIANEASMIPMTEGPCESAMCRLKDGRLMCIFRTGDSPYGQCWSQDEGKTWTTPVAMTQARAVQPSLVVMENGMVALSGGRGGIFLWINADGTGNDWQAVDVRAYHNEFCSQEPIGNWPTTTSYTEIVPLDAEHLLMIYDRIPHGWEAIPPDSGESNSVWVVRIKVSRDAAPGAESMSTKKPMPNARERTQVDHGMSHIATVPDIRSLTQHFNRPGGEIDPWMFVPESNIAEVSTAEHPGTATIRQAGRGQDIKGLLREPIGIGDYPLPWEFQMSLVQNPMAVLLGVGDTRQNNCAIGLNVALTFSDPSTWPKDRTQRPPDTHDFQLLVIHLGNTGEFGAGLPQFAPYRTPETHLVWGRGDLAPELNGDWKIPYFFQGAMPDAGPASPQARFRFHLTGPSAFSVGIKFNDWNEHEMRSVDCSRFGKITGVWEIGPIFSCDRWIPDVLCKELPVLHPEIKDPPAPIPPNPIHEFTADYCAFLPCAPTAPFESFSDEFDVPGFLSWRGFQLPFQAETWSHPGQLTVTLLGASQGTWFFPMTLTEINLTAYPPPWEWEVCFTPPDPPAPWNLYFTHRLIDTKGQWKTYWKPGVIYDPGTKQARFTNDPFGPSSFDSQMEDYFRRCGQDPAQLKPWVKVNMVFDPEPPQEVLQARPLRMLYQMLDKRHLRMGFRGSADGPWHLSKVMDVTEVMGGDIGQLGETCLGIVNGRHFSLPGGMPMYAQYRFDYIRFRHYLTAGTEKHTTTERDGVRRKRP